MKCFTSSYYDIYNNVTDQDFLDIYSHKCFLKELKFKSVNLQYLFKYINDLKCQTILVEKSYIDRDYLIDFSRFYVRCLREYHRKCSRIHFFDDKLKFDKKNFNNLILNKKSNISLDDLNKSYIGFTIIRLLPEKVIGRTVLRPSVSDSDKTNLSCTREYTVHLYGLLLIIKKSLAFQEQDTVTAACATSALWSAFHKTHKLFGLGNPPPPSNITDYATEVLYGSRPITSKGLTIDQMCQAIHKIGLEPHVISLLKSTQITPILSFIYSYIRGGIPAILLFHSKKRGEHAITINGYQLTDKKVVKQEVTSQYTDKYCKLRGLRISEFFVHDDQIGPFVRMNPIDGDDSCPVFFKIMWENKKIYGDMKPVAIIIPLYPKIRVSFLSVYKWISRFNRVIELASKLNENEIEWVIYFSTLSEFKEKIRNNENYTKYFKKILLSEYPRFIWRCFGYFKNKESFEITADATDTQKSFFFIDMNFFDKKFKQDIKSFIQEPIIKDSIQKTYSGEFFTFLKKNTN